MAAQSLIFEARARAALASHTGCIPGIVSLKKSLGLPLWALALGHLDPRNPFPLRIACMLASSRRYIGSSTIIACMLT